MCRLKRSEYFYFYPKQTKNWFELELLPRAKIFQIWAKSFLKKVLAGLKFSHFEVGLKNIRRLFKLINSGGFNTKVSSKLTKLIDNILFKWANPGLFLLIFVLFTFQFKWQIYNLNKLNWKSVDGVLGSQTQGGRWKAQMNPLSYGGTP